MALLNTNTTSRNVMLSQVMSVPDINDSVITGLDGMLFNVDVSKEGQYLSSVDPKISGYSDILDALCVSVIADIKSNMFNDANYKFVKDGKVYAFLRISSLTSLSYLLSQHSKEIARKEIIVPDQSDSELYTRLGFKVDYLVGIRLPNLGDAFAKTDRNYVDGFEFINSFQCNNAFPVSTFLKGYDLKLNLSQFNHLVFDKKAGNYVPVETGKTSPDFKKTEVSCVPTIVRGDDWVVGVEYSLESTKSNKDIKFTYRKIQSSAFSTLGLPPDTSFCVVNGEVNIFSRRSGRPMEAYTVHNALNRDVPLIEQGMSDVSINPETPAISADGNPKVSPLTDRRIAYILQPQIRPWVHSLGPTVNLAMIKANLVDIPGLNKSGGVSYNPLSSVTSLHPGLYVVTGQSNVGKSSFLAGICSAMQSTDPQVLFIDEPVAASAIGNTQVFSLLTHKLMNYPHQYGSPGHSGKVLLIDSLTSLFLAGSSLAKGGISRSAVFFLMNLNAIAMARGLLIFAIVNPLSTDLTGVDNLVEMVSGSTVGSITVTGTTSPEHTSTGLVKFKATFRFSNADNGRNPNLYEIKITKAAYDYYYTQQRSI